MERSNHTISAWQLFILIVLFELGSAIVMSAGSEAKQDSWIAVLAATGCGIVLFTLYRNMQKTRPQMNLFEMTRETFGRPIGTVIVFLYTIYFLYVASRVLRDLMELISIAVLANTPIEMLAFSFVLVCAYTLWRGFGVAVRTAEMFFPFIIGIILILFVLILMDRDYRFDYLRPVLGDGIKPVLSTVFPTLITFPFGELIVFIVFLRYVQPTHQVRSVSNRALVLTGMLLTCAAILETIALGVKARSRSLFPFLNTVRDISFDYFIERMEMIVVFVMFVTILVKVSIFLFGALKGVEYLFRIPYRSMVFPFACLVALLAINVASTYAEHTKEGLKFAPYFLHLPMQVVIPFYMFIVLLLRNNKTAKEGAAQ